MMKYGLLYRGEKAPRRCLCLALALILASGVLWTRTWALEEFQAAPQSGMVSVNGRESRVQAYDIQGVTYYKLRGFAALLCDTVKSFQLTWEGETQSIHMDLEQAYTPVGGELQVAHTAASAVTTRAPFFLDGNEMELFSYCIRGNTYLTLTDLADILQLQLQQEEHGDSIGILNAPVEHADGENAYALTLQAGVSEGVLNGETVSLSAPPLVRDGSFYLPLESVAELLGGGCTLRGDQITLELFEHTSVYTLNAGTYQVDGEVLHLPENIAAFSPSGHTLTVQETYGPLLEQGRVYLPLAFLETGENGLNWDWKDPENSLVILSNFQHELGVEEAKLAYRYETLPQEFQDTLTDLGIVGPVGDLPYEVQAYANDDISIYVTRLRPTCEDVEGIDGKIAAIQVTGSRYRTPRGLRVGDSVQRAKLLYGDSERTFYLTDKFQCQVTDGKVSSLVFGTRYFGGQL